MRRPRNAMTKDEYVLFVYERRASELLESFYLQARNGGWNSDRSYTVVSSWENGVVKELVLSYLQKDGWDVQRKELEKFDSSREWHARQSIVVNEPKF